MEVDGFDAGPTMSHFQFQIARQNFTPILNESLALCDVTLDDFEEIFNKESGSASDKKLAVEQAFKDTVLQLIGDAKARDTFETIFNMSIEASRKGFCNATLPVMLLSDIFDCLTINKCEELFQFVEAHVDTWKLELFFNSTKNNLLRICNDLLRRLSRSQNTVFCGRILLFLAKFFPLSERSGLNVASEFNLENVTVFGSSEDSNIVSSFVNDQSVDTDETEVEDKRNSSIIIDYNLYRKFWSLQDYFRNPSQCYNKMNWRGFITYSDEVLKAFSSSKLDDVKSTRSAAATSSAIDSEDGANQEMYFAKYLTNPKLLDLQLNDSNFRRCVLIQFLILFQYLNSAVKSRIDTHVLTDEQMHWIKNTKERIITLLGETPPDGVKFAEVIEHILTREEHWNQWKNDGCPEFSAPIGGDLLSDLKTTPKTKRQKRKVGDEVRIATANKKILLGNASLTKLWNVYPNNMDACCSQKRDFLPSLESFFEEAIEQADPVNMIEDAYKHVHNSNYGWRALRLLARRSPHFFTPSNQQISKLPLYLETMIKKVAKEIPTSTEESRLAERCEKTVENVDGGGGDDSDDELLKNSEDALKEETNEEKGDDQSPGNDLTDEQIEVLAEKLGTNWKKIASLLGCEEDEIVYYESECSGSVEQAHKMLTVWRDNFREKATPTQVISALNSSGLEELVSTVFNEDSTEN